MAIVNFDTSFKALWKRNFGAGLFCHPVFYMQNIFYSTMHANVIHVLRAGTERTRSALGDATASRFRCTYDHRTAEQSAVEHDRTTAHQAHLCRIRNRK